MEISIDDPFFNEKSLALADLYQVIDPELFINIIDLGLVYDLDFSQEGKIIVTMTLSTPHCPLGDAITSGVKNALADDFPDWEAEVNLVWEPVWNYDMLTEEGRKQLGF